MRFSFLTRRKHGKQALTESESLGLGLKPGDPHYRAYVGPPQDYDLIAAMTFNLLTTLGLRQNHSLLDIGCGSLRVGRVLIPYLNRGKYFGIEPDEWLVKEGIKREIGDAVLQIKRPQFFFSDSPEVLKEAKVSVDFALAQSIFSHSGIDIISGWLSAVSECLRSCGALVATFLPSEKDSPRSGWVYPECISFRPDTLKRMATLAGLRFEVLDWRHPRQTWGLFAKPDFDSAWFKSQPLTWNLRLDKILNRTKTENPAETANRSPVAAVYSEGHIYDQDGLRSIHNHEFMSSPSFVKAYERGVRATGQDYRWHWRVHVGLWAAVCASKLDGDFVECGVNRGFLSSAIMTRLDWDKLGKQFYLLDTFRGMDERFLSEQETATGEMERNRKNLATGFYVQGVSEVRANFSEWKNVFFIEGAIPETLPQVPTQKIAFLHIDMNCSPPEVAAARFFWDRLVPGAFVLLDDYAYHGYRPQKIAMDNFASEKKHSILSLPTGQGLLIKSART
jgi:precorrin-6B methylase 2